MKVGYARLIFGRGNRIGHGHEYQMRLNGTKDSNSMDVEKTIAEVEWLERIVALPDARPLGSADREAANRQHDEMLAANPWFRLWKRYGVCTRAET